MKNIDVHTLKRTINLLDLAKPITQLKYVASTHGGEYAGPCPFCYDHGHDRFRVQPYRLPYGVWMCRHCTAGKWKDAIEFGRRLWPYLRFDQVCARLSGEYRLSTKGTNSPKPMLMPGYQPPAINWQNSARAVIEQCQEELWNPNDPRGIDYLHSRGLHDKTIKQFRLGYYTSPNNSTCGKRINGLWIPRGIVIACEVAQEIWYLKVRLLPGLPIRCQKCKALLPGPGTCPRCGSNNKYRGVKGNRSAALFNADSLQKADVAMFVEGEFDCMIAQQVLGGSIPCVTAGSAFNQLDLAAWGHYLLPLRCILLVMDNDGAGTQGAKTFLKNNSRAYQVQLPEQFKDINDYHLSGGNLLELIRPTLGEIDTLVPNSRACQNIMDSLSTAPEPNYELTGDGRK